MRYNYTNSLFKKLSKIISKSPYTTIPNFQNHFRHFINLKIVFLTG